MGPPVCVLIIEVVLFERLINILIGQLGVLIIEVVLIERCPHLVQVPLYLKWTLHTSNSVLDTCLALLKL